MIDDDYDYIASQKKIIQEGGSCSAAAYTSEHIIDTKPTNNNFAVISL